MQRERERERERERDGFYINEVHIHICISYDNSLSITLNTQVTKEKHCNFACASNTRIFESMEQIVVITKRMHLLY